jgi:hypothetical protein
MVSSNWEAHGKHGDIKKFNCRDIATVGACLDNQDARLGRGGPFRPNAYPDVFDRPRVIRELITRNREELQAFGPLAVRHGKLDRNDIVMVGFAVRASRGHMSTTVRKLAMVTQRWPVAGLDANVGTFDRGNLDGRQRASWQPSPYGDSSIAKSDGLRDQVVRLDIKTRANRRDIARQRQFVVHERDCSRPRRRREHTTRCGARTRASSNLATTVPPGLDFAV